MHPVFLSLLWSGLFFYFGIHHVLAQEPHIRTTHRVIVQFEPDVFVSEGLAKTGLFGFDQKALKYNVQSITRLYPFLDFVKSNEKISNNLSSLRRTYYVQYEADTLPVIVAHDLMQEHGVAYAEPEQINEPNTFEQDRNEPDDPYYDQQSYLQLIRLPEAWDVVKGSDQEPPVIIAIVDSGTELNHEDLLDNQWINEDEIPRNNIDDDQNGFVDDVYGVNFCDQDALNHAPNAINSQMNGSDHGTAVSGVAGAVSDNGIGLTGAAWNAKLMHIKANCPDPNNDFHYEGVMYAAMNGADIINTSWGKTQFITVPPPKYVSETLDLATDLGSLIIASAGNNRINSNDARRYPAQHPRVLSVGATERDSQKIASFSSYGKTVDVFAPGVDILSTTFNNQYRSYNGTSYSAPLIAGVAALVKTRFPDISPDALRQQLRLSSENMDHYNLPRYNGQLGRGFINAFASLTPQKFPGIRLRKWSWSDSDGDRQIDSHDEVTINMQIVNDLVDAHQLTLELVPANFYSFITVSPAMISIGSLANNDSMDVEFRLKVATDAGLSKVVQFYPRIREGAFVDDIEVLTFGINLRLNATFNALKALYNSTNGDHWHNNKNWDLTSIPTIESLDQWKGVSYTKLSLTHLNLERNNLKGFLPKELGNLSQLQVMGLNTNSLTGGIPTELGNLENMNLLSLENNSLSGSIPSELGNLSNLLFMYLQNNLLSGTLPKELGQLTNLRKLNLSGNEFSGSIPPEIGQLSKLMDLNLSNNLLVGKLSRNMMKLNNLKSLKFDGQDLCAPSDPEFQNWLEQIPEVSGPHCSGIAFSSTIEDQSFTLGKQITPLILPEAFGGTPPITYTLEGILPRGLAFNDNSRTITGIPAVTASPTQYHYTATDSNLLVDSLTFTVEVVSPVSNQDYGIPEIFVLHGNYPNPFSQNTHLVFDLPWRATVNVQIYDINGRNVLTVIPKDIEAGWGKTVKINSASLSNGIYIYKLNVSSVTGRSVHHGNFVRLQ